VEALNYVEESAGHVTIGLYLKKSTLKKFYAHFHRETYTITPMLEIVKVFCFLLANESLITLK